VQFKSLFSLFLGLSASIPSIGIVHTARSVEDEALSNGALQKLNFQVSRRISVVMSTFSVFGLSYGRSNNEFCSEEGQNPIFDPLPHNEKLCGKFVEQLCSTK